MSEKISLDSSENNFYIYTRILRKGHADGLL